MIIEIPFVHFHERICPACGALTRELKIEGVTIYSCKRCGIAYTREAIILTQQRDIEPVNN